MALVRALQGPPPGEYHQKTQPAVHTDTYINTYTHFCVSQVCDPALLKFFFWINISYRQTAVTMSTYMAISFVWHSHLTHRAQKNSDTMEILKPRLRNVPGENIPEGGWNQNSGKKRKSTCSARERCIRHPLFTASMCARWQAQKRLIMLC